MDHFVQVSFGPIQTAQQELLIAQLADAGFEGFEQTEHSLEAFIAAAVFDEAALHELATLHHWSYQITNLEAQNWNTQWESNFEPVVVDDFVGIRAAFHAPLQNIEHEILITPKMSFGTGHHATTYMMIQQMHKLDFTGKRVADFGTGTGVLAILAEKLQATYVLAIDNDDWCISNAAENIERNSCKVIRLEKAALLTGQDQFDIILANINKHIITDHFKEMVERLSSPGVLVLSGLLEQDEQDIVDIARYHSLGIVEKLSRSGWISLRISS